nr:40S ribosomal protein S13-like [Ipomoea batatas]
MLSGKGSTAALARCFAPPEEKTIVAAVQFVAGKEATDHRSSHRYGLLAPEREAEGEGSSASSACSASSNRNRGEGSHKRFDIAVLPSPEENEEITAENSSLVPAAHTEWRRETAALFCSCCCYVAEKTDEGKREMSGNFLRRPRPATVSSEVEEGPTAPWVTKRGKWIKLQMVKSVTGSKILCILKAWYWLASEIPKDLYHLIKKVVAIRKHLERNRKDKDSKFRLILVESRIHRLARYYKKTKRLPPIWK